MPHLRFSDMKLPHVRLTSNLCRFHPLWDDPAFSLVENEATFLIEVSFAVFLCTEALGPICSLSRYQLLEYLIINIAVALWIPNSTEVGTPLTSPLRKKMKIAARNENFIELISTTWDNTGFRSTRMRTAALTGLFEISKLKQYPLFWKHWMNK